MRDIYIRYRLSLFSQKFLRFSAGIVDMANSQMAITFINIICFGIDGSVLKILFTSFFCIHLAVIWYNVYVATKTLDILHVEIKLVI